MEKENWLALESNPGVLNEYIQNLGFDVSKFKFNDLYSTEDWARGMIKNPVLGMMLVFPYGQKHKDFMKKEKKLVLEKGQELDKGLFHMRQKAKNACGSVGIYHILLNLSKEDQGLLSDDSVVSQFKKENIGKDLEERGNNFLNNNAIKNIHKNLAKKGNTDNNKDLKIDKHFVSFIPFNGDLYEMDGQKDFPINHGKTSRETFLEDACEIARKFMNRDPDTIEFGIVVLSKSVN